MKITINTYTYRNNKNKQNKTNSVNFGGIIKVPPVILSTFDDIYKIAIKVLDPYDTVDFIGDLATDDD